MDDLYAADIELVFSLLATHVCSNEQVNQSTQSLGTTSVTLTGEYDEDLDTEALSITHGFSKDHRPDLKQVIVELAVAQDGGIPLAMKCHSGNASDNTVFEERAKDMF